MAASFLKNQENGAQKSKSFSYKPRKRTQTSSNLSRGSTKSSTRITVEKPAPKEMKSWVLHSSKNGQTVSPTSAKALMMTFGN